MDDSDFDTNSSDDADGDVDDKGKEVRNDDYRYEFFQQMHKTWVDGMYCDVILTYGNKSSRAHKLVLSTVSEFFKNLFKNKPITKKIDLVEYRIDNVLLTEQSIELLLQYAYTGRIRINSRNVQELFIAVNFLHIDFISSECRKFIVKNIDVDNVLDLITFANRFNDHTMIDEICLFLSKHINVMTEKNAFFNLSVSDFKTLISNKNFTILNHGIPVMDPELEILNSITQYCNLNVNQPATASVSELLSCVNFKDIIDQAEVKRLVSKNIILDCPIMHGILNHSPVPPPTNVLTRKYSNTMKQLKPGRCFGGSNPLPSPKESKNETIKCFNINDRLKTFKMFMTNEQGNLHITGLTVTYQSGHIITQGSQDRSIKECHFTLEKDEVLIRSGVGKVFGLKFWTNCGREFGLYGSDVKGTNTESLRPKWTGYLHSFNCTFQKRECGIEFIRFNWVTYTSEMENSNGKIFDDDYNDSGSDWDSSC